MRIITTRRVNRLAIIALSALVLTVLAINITTYLVSAFKENKELETNAEMTDVYEQVDKYKVRSELLMDAMKNVGVCSPEETVDVWVTGLMQRSAAIQYSVMSDALRTEYVKHLEKNNPNWVTGMSSPWVSGYEVVKTESPNDNTRIVQLTVQTVSSAGPEQSYKAELTITKEENFWRISKMALQEELSAYTGFSVK